MQGLETINQSGIAYMVLRLDETDEIDELAVGMLRNNQIPGLLPMAKRYEHGTHALYYTISSLTPLTQSYEMLGSEKRLIRFLKDYCMVIRNCEEYLLEPKKLLLDEDYVFIKAVTGELSIPYVAVTNTEPADVNAFFMEFVHKVVPKLPPESNILPILYKQSFQETFAPDTLLKELSKLDESTYQRQNAQLPQLTPQPIPKSAPQVIPQSAPRSVPQPIPRSAPQPVPVPQPDSGTKGGLFALFGSNRQKKKNSGNAKAKKQPPASADPLPWDNPFASNPSAPAQEKTPQQPIPVPQVNAPVWPGGEAVSVRNASPVVGRSGYTVHWSSMESGVPGGTIRMKEEDIEAPGSCLGKEHTPVLWLVHQADDHREEITQSNFHVGRKLDGDEVVDYAVANPTGYMGADHAYFQIKDNKFYIVDNNSKNGTWLNKQKLQPSVPYLVKGGDMIRMADEVFMLDQR